jgi:lipopolysaccharide export system permease protein
MEDGFIYDENVRYDASKPPSELPILRGTFQSQQMRFDLSSFQFQRTDEDFYKDSYEMLNVRQLNTYIDTMRTEIVDMKSATGNFLLESFRYISIYYIDSLSIDALEKQVDTFAFSNDDKQKMYANAIQLAREQSSSLDFKTMEYESKEKQLWRYEIEWHRKYVLAIACILLFFVGAPLGAIIRKGGLGVPFAVSILIFVIYWATGMTGERMSRVGTVPSYFGMWLSTIILSPLAIFLIYKASVEAGLSNTARDFIIQASKRYVYGRLLGGYRLIKEEEKEKRQAQELIDKYDEERRKRKKEIKI